jgi:Divergent InlB B-repeat domain/HYR domain
MQRALVVGAVLAAGLVGGTAKAATVVAGSDGWLSAGPWGCTSMARDGSVRATGAPPWSGGAAPWAVAFDGGGVVSVWHDGFSLYAARWSEQCQLQAPGVVELAAPLLVCEYAGWPECEDVYPGTRLEFAGAVDLAFDGTDYAVVWARNIWTPVLGAPNQTIPPQLMWGYATARFTPALQLLDPGVQGGLSFADDHFTGWPALRPSVASSGPGTFVIEGLSPGLGETFFRGGLQPPGAPWSSGWSLVDYQPGWGFDFEPYFPTNCPDDACLLIPSVATSGDTFLAAVTDETLGADGAQIEQHLYWLFPGAERKTLANVTYPLPQPGGQTRVTFDGWHYLVWWDGAYQRVDTAGNPVDPAPRPLPGPLLSAGTDGTHLVAVAGGLGLFTTWYRVAAGVLGSGTGTISSQPAGIACGATCEARFDADWTVTLQAQPSATSRFVGWTGACAGAGLVCTVNPEITRRATTVAAVFADNVSPVVTAPASAAVVATSRDGAVFNYRASAVDNLDGPLAPTCSPASGSRFPPGSTTVTCAATDADGNRGSAAFTVAVQFGWRGFEPPIDPDGRSVFRRGVPVPVRFELAGASAGIPNLSAKLWLAKVVRGVAGPEVPATNVMGPGAGNLFRFERRAGHYAFDLSTAALSAGSWRLRVELGDGVEHAVGISLRP